MDDRRSTHDIAGEELDRRELLDRRQTWNGFSDALARAVELVVTPVLFGLGGWGLDKWLGTRPWFMLGLFLFAIVGMGVRMYYGYAAEMEAHDRAGAWSRPAGGEGAR